jgi:glycosyltransferase involved in cell wall biosynthesis
MSEENEKPLVSIITVCYNSEKYIRDTIESVLNQTYNNIEYVIVDGESTDNTLDIIKEYEPKFNGRMEWISEPDEGIYDAMNKGIDMANGEIIGIINSDDWYGLETVELVVENFLKSNADLIYGNMYKINSELNESFFSEGNLTGKLSKLKINHPTIFIKKYVYEEIGDFKSKYIVGADRDLILRILNTNFKIIKIDKSLSFFRLGGITSQSSFYFNIKRLKQKLLILYNNNVNLIEIISIISKDFLRLFRNLILSKCFNDNIYQKIRIRFLKYKDGEYKDEKTKK